MVFMDYHLDGHIAWLNMADGQNLLTPDFMASLTKTLKSVEQDTDASVLVLSSGDPKVFSNGFDLKGIQSLAREKETERITSLFHRMNALFRYMLCSPLINVAAINGHVFAAGAVLACACDYRIMRRDRGFFCLPEIDLGIPLLPSSLALLQKAMPRDLLLDLIYSGRRITGEEAEARRLVHRACALDRLKETALDLGHRLDKKRAGIAVMKRIVNQEIIDLMDRADPPMIEEMPAYIPKG